MKNNTLTLSIIAMALCLFAFSSCQKSPEEGPQILSEMEVNGQTYPLDGGVLVNWAEVNNGSADYDIALLTEGIVINQEGQPENPGSFIHFDLNSFSASEFEGGSFTFSDERGPGTISGAYLVTDYSGDPNSLTTATYITSGTVDVFIDADVYKVNFSLTTLDGDVVIGNYIGELIKQSNN